MDAMDTLNAMGLEMPSMAYIIGAIIFGMIGFVAFWYGKKTSHLKLKWIGLALMLYPYVVSSTVLMYLIGIGLCAACYYYRHDK